MAERSLPKGLYDLLITQDIKYQLESSELESYIERLHPDDSHQRLADAVAEELSQLLAQLPQQGEDTKLQRQVALLNEVLVTARRHYQPEISQDPQTGTLPEHPSRLLALDEHQRRPELPSIGLAQPWLFTAGKDSPPLLHELSAELANCNQVDILVSFITKPRVKHRLIGR